MDALCHQRWWIVAGCLYVFVISHIALAGHPLIGSSCSPPLGYLPVTCRTLRQVGISSRPLPADEYGVNVCDVTRTYLVQVYEYTYKQQCGWVYNKHYRYYYWSCRLVCVPGSKCSDVTRLEPKNQQECCEGFIPKPVQYNQYNPFYSYYIPENTQPAGCPLAQADTLLECLRIHRLTQFIALIEQAELEHLFNTSNSKITVFVPPNEALGVTNGSLSKAAAVRFVRSYVVDEEVDETRLYHSRQLDTLSDVTLYVTLLEHYFYQPLLWSHPSKGYNPYTYKNYQYQPSNYILLRTDRFISGSKVTLPDACVIENGDLHLIDGAVPIVDRSVTDIITNNSHLSTFNMALEILNLKTFLKASDSPHTIFAPSNTAFRDFPMELIECLYRFDREPLNDLILFHIAKDINYLSSLSQRMWLYTRLLTHMQITIGDNGEILLGESEVPIAIPNIPASDGVIHIVDDLIFPREFEYGDCMSFIGSGMGATGTLLQPMNEGIGK